MVDVLLCPLSQPCRSVSKAPQEDDVVAHVDPATHCHYVVLQDRGPVDQPVELHCSLYYQREHFRGEGGPSTRHDYDYIIPTLKRGMVGLSVVNTILYTGYGPG